VRASNNCSDFNRWLARENDILSSEETREKAAQEIAKAEMIFTLDFNLLSRTSEMEAPLKKATAKFVMIDHHQQPDDYADFMYSDVKASSTCELVFDLLKKMNRTEAISPEMDTCLYTGIMTDTGSCQFSSTTSHTHRVVAALIDKGAENDKIYQHIFDTKSPDQLKLLGTAFKNMVIHQELRTANITLSQKELDAHNYKKGDTEGMVNYGLSLDGVIFAAIFIENKQENIVKISLRSKGDFDVNKLAREYFNGGGHLNAAGGRSDKSLSDTVNYFE